MRGLNGYYKTMVITKQHGVIPTSELVPYDIVYAYAEGQSLVVKGIEKTPVNDMYEIQYTDGRKMFVSYDDIVSTGIPPFSRIPVKELVKYKDVSSFMVHQPVIEFWKHPVYDIDPYTAGALFLYSDPVDPYVNLPTKMTSLDTMLSYAHHLQISSYVTGSKVYFTYTDRNPLSRLKWNEMFPEYKFFAKDNRINDPIFPIEYTMGSIDDRFQLVRGIFDMGYDPSFKGSLTIIHSHEYKLKEVQRILWSLGILSTVRYDPDLMIDKHINFRLDVHGYHHNAPNLFQNVQYKEQMMTYRAFIKHIDSSPVRMKSIRKLSPGYMYKVVLDEPAVSYMNEDFLPVISV